MSDRRAQQRGVTLVETLVALAIMGLVTAGILILVGDNTRFTADARDRVFASIVADNLMVELLASTETDLAIGLTAEPTFLAGRNWFYEQTITETGVETIVRIDILVRTQEGGQVIARASTLREEGQ